MKVEFEEFDDVEDVFMFLATVAAPLKNTMPINSYEGYTMSFIPLSQHNERYLMVYAKTTLEPGIYEFDISSKTYHSVQTVERADKVYFVVLTPKRNTLADKAIQEINSTQSD